MKSFGMLLAFALTVFGSLAQAAAPAPRCAGIEHIVQRGETPSQIFGKEWGNQLKQYGISDPRKLPVGLKVCVTTATKWATSPANSTEFLWKKPGGSPVASCGGKSEAQNNERAWEAHGIPESDRVELREMVQKKTSDFEWRQIAPGETFREMSSCDKRTGTVVVVRKIRADWGNETAVHGRVLTLSSGKRWMWVRNCNNWLPLQDAPVTPVAQPSEKVVESSPPSVEQLACDEWNIRASAGIERSIGSDATTTAMYGDVEVGSCPFTWKRNQGKTFSEALIVARGHLADDYFHGWNGNQRLLLAGVGLRESHKDGSGDLYRLMLGQRSNEGSQGKYRHDATWSAIGLFWTHYLIGKNGENETHFRAGIALPLGKAHGSASYDGAPLDMPKWDGNFEAGVRYYFNKKGEKVRFFGEFNASAVLPDYAGISPRLGVCNEDEIVCLLAGVNIGLYPATATGYAAAIGVQVNTPGVIRVGRDGVRTTAVVEAANAKGITFEFTQKVDETDQEEPKAGQSVVFEIATDPPE